MKETKMNREQLEKIANELNKKYTDMFTAEGNADGVRVVNNVTDKESKETKMNKEELVEQCGLTYPYFVRATCDICGYQEEFEITEANHSKLSGTPLSKLSTWSQVIKNNQMNNYCFECLKKGLAK